MRRSRRWPSLAAALFLLVIVFAGCSAASPEPSPSGTALPEKTVLERQKLAAEVQSIHVANAAATDGSNTFIRLAPLLTVLVAAGTLVITFTKDRRASREAREKEMTAAATEAQKRHAESVAAVVQNLGAASPRLRLGAAAALAPILRDPTDPRIASDLTPVIVANLRVEDDQDVRDVLVRDLGIALRRPPLGTTSAEPLDLTRTQLRRLRIPEVSLPGADVAFAVVAGCDLTGCDLRRLRGFGVDFSGGRLSRANLHEARLNEASCRKTQFHDARLVSVTFKGADLTGAQFQRAGLQGARLQAAICQGAVFTGANLAEAWFLDPDGGRPAILDESALRTVVGARNWRQAHWTKNHRRVLEQLSQGTP